MCRAPARNEDQKNQLRERDNIIATLQRQFQ
jgi:hypothetical protein